MFWQRFAEWHALYGPPGDSRVQREAMALAMLGAMRDIADVMVPAIQKVAQAVVAASAAIGKAFSDG